MGLELCAYNHKPASTATSHMGNGISKCRKLLTFFAICHSLHQGRGKMESCYCVLACFFLSSKDGNLTPQISRPNPPNFGPGFVSKYILLNLFHVIPGLILKNILMHICFFEVCVTFIYVCLKTTNFWHLLLN